MADRLALLYSDGSIGVLAAGTTREKADEEARGCDEKETDPAHFTAVARVRVEIVAVLGQPALASPTDPGGACRVCGRA